MREATPSIPHVLAGRFSAYEAGVTDGDACRRRGGKPSVFLLVARADDYSAGFRAGFFRRAVKGAAISAEETERREMQRSGYGKGGG